MSIFHFTKNNLTTSINVDNICQSSILMYTDVYVYIQYHRLWNQTEKWERDHSSFIQTRMCTHTDKMSETHNMPPEQNTLEPPIQTERTCRQISAEFADTLWCHTANSRGCRQVSGGRGVYGALCRLADVAVRLYSQCTSSTTQSNQPRVGGREEQILLRNWRRSGWVHVMENLQICREFLHYIP